MLSAFIAAIGNSIEVLTSKVILREKGVSYKNFISLSMVFIFILVSIAFIFLGKIDFENLKLIHVASFVGIIVAAYFYNNLYFYSLYKEKVCEVEPIAMLEPLVTVSMAALIFPSERNIPAFLLTAIACLALVFSRIDKKHLKLNKYTIAMLGFVFLISIESQLAKVVLEVTSPVAFYCFRVAILSLLFLAFLKPNFKKLEKTEVGQIFFVAAITAIELVSRFYAISQIGIVKSSLIFLLGPVLILLSSKLILKEKITLKKAIGDTVIVICVAFASFVG